MTDVNENLGPVNPNLVSYTVTSKEKRSVGLVKRLTDLDEEHALEFVRIFSWEIGNSQGGAEGLLKSDKFKHLLKRDRK